MPIGCDYISPSAQCKGYGWLFSARSVIIATVGILRTGLKRTEHAFCLQAGYIS